MNYTGATAMARRLPAIFAILVLCLLSASGLAAQATGSVRGRVLESGGQQPIPEVVVNAVGILSPTGAQTFDRVHVDGARAIAKAARLAGVRRLVHVSAIGDVRGAYAQDATLKPVTVNERTAAPQADITGFGDLPLKDVPVSATVILTWSSSVAVNDTVVVSTSSDTTVTAGTALTARLS